MIGREGDLLGDRHVDGEAGPADDKSRGVDLQQSYRRYGPSREGRRGFIHISTDISQLCVRSEHLSCPSSDPISEQIWLIMPCAWDQDKSYTTRCKLQQLTHDDRWRTLSDTISSGGATSARLIDARSVTTCHCVLHIRAAVLQSNLCSPPQIRRDTALLHVSAQFRPNQGPEETESRK